jgi:hypothetical protein
LAVFSDADPHIDRMEHSATRHSTIGLNFLVEIFVKSYLDWEGVI